MIDLADIAMAEAGLAALVAAGWALGHWQGMRAGQRVVRAPAIEAAVAAPRPAHSPAGENRPARTLVLPEGMTLTDLHEEISAFRQREKVLLQVALAEEAALAAASRSERPRAAPFNDARAHPERHQPAVDAFWRV